jgi:hypothetical protein
VGTIAAAAVTHDLHALPVSAPQGTSYYPEVGTLLPDEGWRLWIDAHAPWQQDEIYLPEDVAWAEHERKRQLCGNGTPLPVNEPIGGWGVLSTTAGIGVTLPSSVEQHLWGQYGAGDDGRPRPYTPQEYRYAKAPSGAPADDDVPQNGAYFGVSWWYRPIEIPASMAGKRIYLHVRGAHLRAEVYLNGQLCGYSIMEELPFEADLTQAAKPGGENLLAIRITNPFGRFDWVDGLNAKWGSVSLYRSHGFGALDRGMTISAHEGSVRIKDAWVLNAEANAIYARTQTEVIGDTQPSGYLQHEILDPDTGKIVLSMKTKPAPQRQKLVEHDAGMMPAHVTLWDIRQPKLYHLRTTWVGDDGHTDTRTVAFGFRSFTVEGLGSNALFRLNGRRIRIYTAISWGFWGLNGMFPVPELAEKEVRAAQELGLNCLNFHRNLAKEDVLRWHDALGMLRYMEPGAGKMAIGRLPAKAQANAAGIVMEEAKSEADRFAQRYMFTKCVEMVKAFRSHPSVFEYCLQNELGADLKNPATLAVLKAMHDEDPSRCVVLNDGFVKRGAAQAWYEPWSVGAPMGKLHRSDEEPWGDWWNDHQGAGDQWYDEFYKSPTEYTYRAPYHDVITEFGEMEGCARPDIHGLMIHQIKDTYRRYGGDSYDLQDHEAIFAGYERFLDRWGFRAAFPSPDKVFYSVGRTCYESWMNYMENARISDELDFAAISGWESTAIENHSGIVDNLRNFKSDPKLIAGSLLPVRPLAKQRALTIERGKSAVFDLYLANDTSKAVTGTLRFEMVTPSGRLVRIKELPTPAQTPDQFSYLLAEAVTTPALEEAGLYRFRFSLSTAPLATQTKELWVCDIAQPKLRSLRVGVSGVDSTMRHYLELLSAIHGLRLESYRAGMPYDVIVSSGMTTEKLVEGQIGETTGESLPGMKPGHKPEPGEAPEPKQTGRLEEGIVAAVRAGTPLLVLAGADALADGVAKQLAAANAFRYDGAVGDFRAPWMGNWYFVRAHALFAGMPVNQAMGGFYQAKGRQSNGLLVEQAEGGAAVEVMVGYSRDHDRRVGAGTFTTRLGKGKLVFHRVPEMQAVMQQRFLLNALRWLTEV